MDLQKYGRDSVWCAADAMHALSKSLKSSIVFALCSMPAAPLSEGDKPSAFGGKKASDPTRSDGITCSEIASSRLRAYMQQERAAACEELAHVSLPCAHIRGVNRHGPVIELELVQLSSGEFSEEGCIWAACERRKAQHACGFTSHDYGARGVA